MTSHAMVQNGSRTLKSVEKTLRIIESLYELRGATIIELADHLDMSSGGIHHHLATLKKHQFVVCKDNEYHLSHRFFNFGHFVKHQNQLYNIAKPELENLGEEVSEHIVLTIEEYGKLIVLYRVIQNRGLPEEFNAQQLEVPGHMHFSSAGKAMLSRLSKERVDKIIDENGLPRKTDSTITDREALHDHLEEVRDRGYAISDEELRPGIRSVGKSICSGGELVGAICITGPSSRMSLDRLHSVLADKLIETANVIEIHLEAPQEMRGIRY